MNDLYDETFVKSTIVELEDNVKDLELWSAYNDDKSIDLINILKKVIKLIKEEV